MAFDRTGDSRERARRNKKKPTMCKLVFAIRKRHLIYIVFIKGKDDESIDNALAQRNVDGKVANKLQVSVNR